MEPLGMNVSATTRNAIPARSAIVTPRMTNQRSGRMLGLFAQAGPARALMIGETSNKRCPRRYGSAAGEVVDEAGGEHRKR